MKTTAANIGANVGRVMILPSTFVGSSRYMMQNYWNSMGIVQKFG